MKENQKKLPLGVTIALSILGGVLLIIIGFCIWLFFPVKNIPVTRLLPRNTIGYFSLNLASGNPGMLEFHSQAESFLFETVLADKKIPFARQAFPLFLPKEVGGLIALDPDSGSPLLAAVIRIGNPVKLVSLFSGLVDDALFGEAVFKKESVGSFTLKALVQLPEETGITAYGIAGNSLLAGTDPRIIRNAMNSFSEGYDAYPYLGTIAGRLAEDQTVRDGQLYLDNSQNGLSKLIQALEEKVAFAAFPSIDAIEYMAGDFLITAEALEGRIIFSSRDPARMDEIRGDAKFFYGAIRRLLRPRNLDMKAQINIEADNVIFDFKIENFMENLFAYLVTEQEEGEEE